MVTGELKSQIDRIWNDFWSGGISNPLEIIEQLTYLLFLKRLDDLQLLEENKANRLGLKLDRRIFPAGFDGLAHDGHTKGRSFDDFRWSRLKNLAPAEMYEVVSGHVFPFLRDLGGDGSTYAKHMRDARFTIPTPALLAKAVDGLSDVPMVDRDTKGDVYEYMLSKIATAGQNGQFRTPRHIIELMVAIAAPTPTDTICDPASGTCGFLVAAGEYVRAHHPAALRDAVLSKHFHEQMFNGFDFDNVMLRIGSMNMLLHGIERPNVEYKDSLAQDYADEEEAYSLILANPPFSGSLDFEGVARDLLGVVRTKKTELLFLALFLRLMKPGARAAVIVPDGVLYGDTRAHKEIRRVLIEEQRLDAVIALPSGVFRPYTAVTTAILCFTKTNSGGTESAWFYDLRADGFSLDDRREPLLPKEKLGVHAELAMSESDLALNNLPDVLRRYAQRSDAERARTREDQSFLVPIDELRRNSFDLSISTYRRRKPTVTQRRQPSHGSVPALSEVSDELLRLSKELAELPQSPRARADVERVDLGDIVQFVGGGTPSRSRPEFYEGSVCWATSKDMKSDYLDDTIEHITEEAIAGSATKLVPPGTVLVVVKSKILAHSLPVAVTRVPTCFGQDLKGITVQDGWLPEYIAAALRGGAASLLERARGANTEGLTLKHLRAFQIPALSLEQQTRVVETLVAVERTRDALGGALRSSEALLADHRLRVFEGRS